jgi:hypothetical protein
VDHNAETSVDLFTDAAAFDYHLKDTATAALDLGDCRRSGEGEYHQHRQRVTHRKAPEG